MKTWTNNWSGVALAAFPWIVVGFIVALVTGTSMGYSIDLAYVAFVGVGLVSAFAIAVRIRGISDNAAEIDRPNETADEKTESAEPEQTAEAA